jgi:hypothetical protein
MTIHGGDEGEGDVRVWEEGTKAEGLSRPCNKTGAAAVKRENFSQEVLTACPPAPLTRGRLEHCRSRQVIRASRALIASAQALIQRARQGLARQRALRIVCAWCQETIRFERAAGAAWGQISHSICFACFAHVFGELDSGNAPPPFSQKVHQC